MSAIRVEGVSKRYAYRPVLSGVTFAIEAGEHVAVTGVNGAGKSTLLKLLAGLVRPDSGRISLFGTADSRGASTSLGYLGHEPQFYRELSVAENLRLFCPESGVLESQTSKNLLERLSLQGVMRDPMRVCSPGVTKRVGIARAFLLKRRLLLFDEPYANLDSDGCQLLDSLLHEAVSGGQTVVSVVHDEAYLQRHQPRRLRVENRKVVDIHVVQGRVEGRVEGE